MSGRRLYAIHCDHQGCVAVSLGRTFMDAMNQADGWHCTDHGSGPRSTHLCPDHRSERLIQASVKHGDLMCVRCGSGPLQPKKRAGVPITLRHWGKGRCGKCWRHTQDEKKTAPPARTARKAVHVLEDWEYLRSWGYTKPLAAERLGMTVAAFDRALLRAKERAA